MKSATQRPGYKHFDYRQLSGALGAEISGIQLNGDLSTDAVAELNQALLKFKVLFFRNQEMDNHGHAAFAQLIGTPVDADFIPAIKDFPMITRQQYDEYSRMTSDVNFHHDDSFHKYPTKMSVLRGLDIPDFGGDTTWVNMEQVYESLSEPLQKMLEGLTAEHSLAKNFTKVMLEDSSGAAFDKMMERNPPHIHPLVIRHPETGRKSLYVSELLTSRIIELAKEESDLLLNYLCQKAYQPEFACRFSWEKNSVAWWDNRNTIHRGIDDDFYPALRSMQRIAIADEKRPSLHPENEPVRDFSDLDIVPCNSLDDEPATEPGNNSTSQPAEVDTDFLATLNDTKAGITFTPEASVRIKTIPGPFRGAALSAIFDAAEERNTVVIDDEILDIVQASR